MKWFLMVLLMLAQPVLAESTAATLFSAKRTPAPGAAVPVGTYAKGCAQGNLELPETGPTWQAMRLSRHRNFGQPVTLAFLQDLSAFAVTQGWAGLYIGDIGNPRGGPMNSGHASHQMGLDVDIWQLPATRLNLSRAQREELSSVPVRSADQLSVTRNWTPANHAIMRAAARDPRVDRIFVAAAVKIEMCKSATAADTAWLQKIRPEGGHDTHFHVRLKCPQGVVYCQTQKPAVSELSKGGNGCDATLAYWVSDAYLHPKPVVPAPPPQPRKRTARELLMSDLPAECGQVLAAD